MTTPRWFDPETIPKLRRMVGPKVAREVIGLFFEETPKRLDAVRGINGSDDLEEATRALHSLKSSAGMLGGLGLQELSEELELLARNGDCKALDARIHELEAAVERLEPLLRAELEVTDP